MTTMNVDLIVAVLELPDKSRPYWAVDDWRCRRTIHGTPDCVNRGAGDYSAWVGWDSDGGYAQPFVALYENGRTEMVCEDCANELGWERDAYDKALFYEDNA